MKSTAALEPSRRDWARVDTRMPRRQRKPFDWLTAVALIGLVAAAVSLVARTVQLLASDDVGAPPMSCAVDTTAAAMERAR